LYQAGSYSIKRQKIKEIMENITKDYSHIKDWGVDADPKNDPTYPIKHRTDEEHKGYAWQRPAQQPVNIEVLHSNERPNVSAVFGTSEPPKGLSGSIRRFAFRYSEGSFAHWIPLLVADRVNVVEGIISDLRNGHIPNIYAERGGNASWKYNKKGVLKKALVGVVVASVAFALFRKNKKREN
jgi:hypothetical protein